MGRHPVAKVYRSSLANQLVGDKVEGRSGTHFGPVQKSDEEEFSDDEEDVRFVEEARERWPRRSAEAEAKSRGGGGSLWAAEEERAEAEPTRCLQCSLGRGSTSPRLTPLVCTCCADDANVADFMFDADEAPHARTPARRASAVGCPLALRGGARRGRQPAPGTDAFQAAVSQVDAPQTPQGKQPVWSRPRTSGCTFGKPVPTPGASGPRV